TFGAPPNANRLAVAWAQCALEHGRGKAIWCHNIGNITAGKGWSSGYYVLSVPPPDPPTLKFRSHTNFIDGASDYWRVLAGQYASALKFFDAGEPMEAAAALKTRGYFTAELEPYARAMSQLYADFRSKVLPAL